MRIIVTAGPTREYIDDVRFISNPSSGRMGYAVAKEAARRGHRVHLVSGPVCLSAPEGVRVSRFESVEELYGAVSAALGDADCLIMAAAVGDYRVKERFPGKRKKGGVLTLELAATRDVLASAAERKGDRVFVGFAVEAENGLENARKKIAAKRLDMLVLNSPESFGADEAEFALVFPAREPRALGRVAKAAAAKAILEEVEALFGGSKTP